MTTDRDALLDFLDKSFEEPVISPVTYRAFRPQIVSMLDRIAAEPPALDVERLYDAMKAVEDHGKPLVAGDYLAVAATYTRLATENIYGDPG